MEVPTRVVLNFSSRCNLACPWCYVPFVGGSVDEDACSRVVTRLRTLGFSAITFGGGDPFAVPFLPSLISLARGLGFFVHVDTNAIGLSTTEASYSLVGGFIDLLGLPLDGPNAEVHDRIRRSKGHFQTVERVLRFLAPFRSKTKINTFVSAQNVACLPELGALVAEFGVSRWSVYEYWPLAGGRTAAAQHELGDADFLASATAACARVSPTETVVEIVPAGARRLTYPLVDHRGILYVHSNTQGEFDELGSIFDDSNAARAARLCVGDRPEAASRYTRPTACAERTNIDRPGESRSAARTTRA